MLEHNVKKLMHLLGEHHTGDRGDWLEFSCVFAPWKHHNGTDNNPSFGVLSNAEGPSFYKCWSCGAHGDLDKLVMEMLYQHRQSPGPKDYEFKAALHLIANEELEESDFLLEDLDYEELKKKKHEQSKVVPFPEDWLGTFMTRYDHPYLLERGIPMEVGQWLDVRYDFSQARVCFPIRTFDGTLAGLQGRAIHKDNKLRYKLYDHHGVFNRHVWGNEHNVLLDVPLVLTEGFFDLAKIGIVWTNALCSLTSEITPIKAKRIRDAEHIITLYDFGTGGNKAREQIDKYAKQYGWMVDHMIPDEETGDAGNMDPGDIAGALEHVLHSAPADPIYDNTPF